MMQLQELIIKNFKSFDYTKIPFNKGLHIVVGPNGSGKSNVVDALLFVFGTTSLKKLRVDKLTNLINHHTKAKTALVRVVIKNNDQTIEISREIDKERKSVFSLNGKRKALHEIMSYLNELGINTDGFNTVQQGDVTRIINLNSLERREILDDVSGIFLFDARKKEAEDNLKKVKERLDKVSIALKERKPYVEQLKEEKENAIKYKEFEVQENKLNYSQFKKQIDYYNQEIEEYQSDLKEKENLLENKTIEKQEVIQKIKNYEANLEKINQDLIDHSEKVQTTIGKQLSELNAKKEIVLNNLSVLENNKNYLSSQNQKASNELTSLKKEIEELKIIIKNIDEKIKSKNKEKDKIKIELDKNKKDFDEVKKIQDQLYDSLSNENKNLTKTQDIYFEKKNRLNAYLIQKENLENQNTQITQRIQSFTTKSKELDEKISVLKKNIKVLESELLDKEKLFKNNLNEKASIEKKLNNHKIELSSLKKELSSSTNISNKRKEIASTLKKFKSFKGFLDENLSLTDTEKSFYISSVVLEDDSQIKDIISSVDYNLSFIILSSLNIKEKDLSKYYKSKFKEKESKIKIKDYYFDGFSFRKIIYKDTTKIEKQIKETSDFIEKLESDHKKLVLDNTNLEKELKDIKEKLNIDKISLNTNIAIKDDLVEKLNEDALTQKNQTTILNITSNVGQLEKELKSLKEEISKITTKKQDLEHKLKKFNVGVNDTLRNEYDELVSEINLLEQSLISKDSDKKIYQEKIDTKSNYILENNKKLKNLEQEFIALKDRQTNIENNILKISKDFESEDSKKNTLYEKKQEVSKSINNYSQKIYSYDSEISDINLSLNNIKIMISTNQSKVSQTEQNLKLLDIKKEEMVLLDLSLEEINSEIRKLKREKNALGNINFNAIDSYEKLAKEYDEILSKCEVLEKEKEQVESMLKEINLKKKTVFIDCYTKINKEFKDIIKKMSSSISGELVLDGENVLESKLLINITKGGKTKDIDIMSGGEKAITALAFIFALYAYKKAPFYILDEVDAALDEFNSKTLLNFIRNISKDTTIVSVSHNPTFISGADQIIGVTLKEHTSVIGLNLK